MEGGCNKKFIKKLYQSIREDDRTINFIKKGLPKEYCESYKARFTPIQENRSHPNWCQWWVDFDAPTIDPLTPIQQTSFCNCCENHRIMVARLVQYMVMGKGKK